MQIPAFFLWYMYLIVTFFSEIMMQIFQIDIHLQLFNAIKVTKLFQINVIGRRI